MKKLFAIFALVAFFGAIASPAIAAAYSAPITVKVNDDKPKKAKVAADSEKKSTCTSDKKTECTSEKKASCDSKKACTAKEEKK
jgi:hypothetical protein